jgi:hypothetical protein
MPYKADGYINKITKVAPGTVLDSRVRDTLHETWDEARAAILDRLAGEAARNEAEGRRIRNALKKAAAMKAPEENGAGEAQEGARSEN